MLDLFIEQEEATRERVNDGIERYRKGDFTLTLTDENGAPLAGKPVKLTQKTHEFRYGANLFLLDELETDEKNEAYK